jgi:thiol-disulfide isomerase/thioredoxin
MKSHPLIAACLAVVLSAGMSSLRAQQGAPAAAGKAPAAAKSPAAADLEELIAKVRKKLQEGKKAEADLAAELKEFNALIVKHAKAEADDLANILFMKGTLYLEVLGDEEKGKEILTQVKTDYPNSKRAGMVDRTISSVAKAAEAKKAKGALVGAVAPELNFAWGSREGLKTLSALKGKVVVLDFWATWCGPCVRSFPDIKELAAHYKGYDVEVIGVTSVQGKVHGLEAKAIDCEGDPAKEFSLMKDYMKAKDITWTIAFSNEEVFNPNYGVTGIPHMTIISPAGKVSENGIHPGATPFAKKKEMIDKLLKEAGLKVPPGA